MKNITLFRHKYGNTYRTTMKDIKAIRKKINGYNVSSQTKAIISISNRIYALLEKQSADLVNTLPRLKYKDFIWFWSSLNMLPNLLSQYLAAEKSNISDGSSIGEFLNIVFSTELILNDILTNYAEIYNSLSDYFGQPQFKHVNIKDKLIRYKSKIDYPEENKQSNQIYAVINAIRNL